MRHVIFSMVICMAALATACAGREPAPVNTAEPTDRHLTCEQIYALIDINNQKIRDLSGEEGGKVAQNVAAGVAGVFIWPLWFAMDFQDAAGKEASALQDRNRYLAILAAERCGEMAEMETKTLAGANANHGAPPRTAVSPTTTPFASLEAPN